MVLNSYNDSPFQLAGDSEDLTSEITTLSTSPYGVDPPMMTADESGNFIWLSILKAMLKCP